MFNLNRIALPEGMEEAFVTSLFVKVWPLTGEKI